MSTKTYIHWTTKKSELTITKTIKIGVKYENKETIKY